MNSEIELTMKESRRSRRMGSSRNQKEHFTKVYTEGKCLTKIDSEDSDDSLDNYVLKHLQNTTNKVIPCITEEPISYRRSLISRSQLELQGTQVDARVISDKENDNDSLNEYIEEYTKVVMNEVIELMMQESRLSISMKIWSKQEENCTQVRTEKKSLERKESGIGNKNSVDYISSGNNLTKNITLQTITEEYTDKPISCRRSRNSKRHLKFTRVNAKSNPFISSDSRDVYENLNEYIEEYVKVVMQEEMELKTKGQKRTRRRRGRKQEERCTLEDENVKCLERNEHGDASQMNNAEVGIKLDSCSERSESCRIVSKRSEAEENAPSEYGGDSAPDHRHTDNIRSNTDTLVTNTKSGITITVKHITTRRSSSGTSASDSKHSLYYSIPPAFSRTLIPSSYRCKSIDHYTVPISNGRHSDCTTTTKRNRKSFNNDDNINKARARKLKLKVKNDINGDDDTSKIFAIDIGISTDQIKQPGNKNKGNKANEIIKTTNINSIGKRDGNQSSFNFTTFLKTKIKKILKLGNTKKDELKINLHKRTPSIDILGEKILKQTRKKIREEESRSSRKLNLVRKKMKCYSGTESFKTKTKKIENYNRKLDKIYDGKPPLFTSKHLQQIYEGAKTEKTYAVGILHKVKFAMTNIGLL